MKLNLQEDKSLKEAIIDITYNVFDRRIQRVIEIVETNNIQLKGEKDGHIHLINSQDIYYIESVDNSSFLYTELEVFEAKEKLYVLENKLEETSFIRINKSTILNMDYLDSVSPLPNYRLEANLKNGEKVIISRHYMKNVKQYLKIS
ncbi:LytTR family DNA-binding domain-containing protein [Atopococcus tabaci]|uniref:LytTR family DNA-binding domain-containing protein n=1 Tax=Atopococcus tabaci TaxID=269774 RepID=UPI00040BDEC5|nr:LytTR family DNA-binding domain-containing protein [Atopococcus tabaci]